MPLDYNIPLMAQPFDAQGTFNNALVNGQNLNAIKNMPLDNQLLQQKVQAGNQTNYDAHAKQLYGAALAAKPYLDKGDIPGAISFAQRHAAQMKAAGLPTNEIDQFAQALQSDPNQAKQIVNDTIAEGAQLFPDHAAQFGGSDLFSDGTKIFYGTQVKDPKTGGVKTALSAIDGSNSAPSGQLMPVNKIGLTSGQIPGQKAAETAAELGARLANEPQVTAANANAQNASNAAYAGPIATNTAQAKANVEAATAPGIEAAKTGATATENRLQEWVTAGANAADTTPVLRRSIDLLNTVKTGGLNKVLYEVQHFAGIESADAGELSHMLAKNVLQQLRPTFGSQFTRAEGDKLDGIEARLGNSPDANMRLLQQALRLAEKSAYRARDIATKKGDLTTASAISDSLKYSLSELPGTSQKQQAQPVANQPAAATQTTPAATQQPQPFVTKGGVSFTVKQVQ